jgi:hypothetical protein
MHVKKQKVRLKFKDFDEFREQDWIMNNWMFTWSDFEYHKIQRGSEYCLEALKQRRCPLYFDVLPIQNFVSSLIENGVWDRSDTRGNG